MNKMSKDHMEMADQFKHFMDEITQNQPKRLADNYFFSSRRRFGKDSFRSQRGDYLKKQQQNNDKQKMDDLNLKLNELNRQLNDLNRQLQNEKRQPNNEKRQISQEKNA